MGESKKFRPNSEGWYFIGNILTMLFMDSWSALFINLVIPFTIWSAIYYNNLLHNLNRQAQRRMGSDTIGKIVEGS